MTSKPSKKAAKAATKSGAAPKLLSGGNPQIPKGEGDAPVQAYIAAMPGWKHDLGRRLDALIVGAVPDVHKAVKWNSPFYGVERRAAEERHLHVVGEHVHAEEPTVTLDAVER